MAVSHVENEPPPLTLAKKKDNFYNAKQKGQT